MEALCARRAKSRIWTALAALLCCLCAAPTAWAAPTLARKGVRYAKVDRVCPPPKPGEASCLALSRVPVSSADAGEPGVAPYVVNDGAASSGPAGGLTPAELASAYGYEPNASGEGQTVAIVDAFDDPNIESDLGEFDAEYGLPACTTADKCFEKVSQTGSTTSLPAADKTGWSVEISLDVEAAHSTCPKCKILLVEAKNTELSNLAVAVDEAVNLGATEVSNSYGGPEGATSAAEEDGYDHPGVVIAAATGDNGYDGWTSYVNEGRLPAAESPDFPASSPSVVAVGGTTLELDEAGTRESERVWNGNGPFDESFFVEGFAEGATGGGCSTAYTAPLWQQRVAGYAATGCAGKRLAADVSAVADPLTGFDIYDTYNCGKSCESFKRGRDWLTIGGTSLSTPLISSLYALAGGADGVSYPALTLYGHLGDSSDLYDVTEGGNGICDDGGLACEGNVFFEARVDCEGTTACNAASGFDGPSGVGTPNGLGPFKPLLPVAAITPPASANSGFAASFSSAGSSDPYPGAVDSYSWSWGDGTPESTGAAPEHTYSAPGKYTVTLTLKDSYGFTSVPATVSVTVTEKTAKELKEEKEAKEAQEAKEAKEAKEAQEAREAKEAKERETREREVKEAKEREVKETKEREAREAKGREAKEQQEAKEVKEREEAAANKKHEEELAAKSSVNAGSQGVNGFQAHLAAPVPDAQLAGTTLPVSSTGSVTLKISCPAGETSCVGTVTLRTLAAVTAGDGRVAKAKASVLTLASGSFTVPGGNTRTITLHLSAKARALLARVHTLRSRATLLAHDLQGASHTTLTLVTLRAASTHHKG